MSIQPNESARISAEMLKSIKRSHLLQAIKDFQNGHLHRFVASTGYDLIHEGRTYPPKAILGLAGRYTLGRVLEPEDFSGGEDSTCFRILRKEGFTIKPKEAALSDLVFMKATDAFNKIGALKSNGTPYGSVRGLSVSAAGPHFRFWEKDIVRHTGAEMELYRPAEDHVWNNKPEGRAFYTALRRAMEQKESIFVTINRTGGFLPDGTAITKDAAPILTLRGEPAPGRVIYVNPESNELRVLIDLTGDGFLDLKQPYVDQFLVKTAPFESAVETFERTGKVYSRSAEVRRLVLDRAAGHCERCGVIGFETENGLYLETHHVVPLSESGRDWTGNVIALCPTCHRQAHFALDRQVLKAELLHWLQSNDCGLGA